MDIRCDGKVWLVGAGTGDAGLITVKGLEILKKAEVVIFDALISLEVLSLMPQDAELIDAGKRARNHLIPQDEINALLLKKAKEGKRVVRLKGGDPFVFGRGAEELLLLAKEGIDFEVVSGITSSIAVPAYNGIPVTHRDYTSSFHVITGHNKSGTNNINFKALVQLDATLIFLMGVLSLENICAGLIDAGIDINTPAAILENGTTYRQRKIVATISTLKEAANKAFIESPAVIIVGKVCSLESIFSWYDKMPLSGKQILVTRPKGQETSFISKLKDKGAHIIHMPTIKTIPVDKLNNSKKFYNAIEKMSKDECKKCVVFTSPQGVKHFFGLLKRGNIDIRKILFYKDLSFAVIGSATKDALAQYGIFADYMPLKYSSEELGEMLVKELSTDTHIYIFRAKDGSIELTKKLIEAQMSFDDITIYHTVYAKSDILTDKIKTALEYGEIDYVTFTSASTIKGFVKAFYGINFKKINAVCIGKKTAKEALKHGMNAIVSKEASMDFMVESILRTEGKL